MKQPCWRCEREVKLGRCWDLMHGRADREEPGEEEPVWLASVSYQKILCVCCTSDLMRFLGVDTMNQLHLEFAETGVNDVQICYTFDGCGDLEVVAATINYRNKALVLEEGGEDRG